MTKEQQARVIRNFVQWLEDTATFTRDDLSALLQAEQDYKKELEDETD
jgi:hypothetical protein